MRLVFMGTPDFSVAALDAIVAAGHSVVCVYTQPPRPAGRGKKPRPSAVQARAEALGIEVRSPLSLRDPSEQAGFAALNADAAVVVAYGLILPQAILDAPAKGCLNIHASLLPRWRGAAPIQRAIMAGDDKSGVCIMQMDAGLDTGAVLLREEVSISADETASTLHDRLAVLCADMIVKTLAEPEGCVAESQPQEGVTYAEKIDKTEARVNWSLSAHETDCHIRGLSPFPGAWTMIRGERVKLLLSSVEDGTGTPGTALDDQLLIACGTGAVRVLRLQRPGKGAMGAEAFLKGFPVPSGSVVN